VRRLHERYPMRDADVTALLTVQIAEIYPLSV
jgi:hypothetical protein